MRDLQGAHWLPLHKHTSMKTFYFHLSSLYRKHTIKMTLIVVNKKTESETACRNKLVFSGVVDDTAVELMEF